jgi:hypothetical protein
MTSDIEPNTPIAAAVGQAMGRELAEADWWRLLDALLLIAAHPSASAPERSETRDSPR